MLDWPTVAIRLALYLILAALFGLSAFSLYGLRLSEREDAIALRPWLTASAALGLLLSAVGLILMASAMAGSPFWPIDQAAVAALLGGQRLAPPGRCVWWRWSSPAVQRCWREAEHRG